LLGHGDKTIVAIGFAFLLLLRFKDANQDAIDQATGEQRLVGKHQHVEGVAFFGFGGGNKSEVVGEHHSFGQDLGKCELACDRIELQLVAAAFWGLDDDFNVCGSSARTAAVSWRGFLLCSNHSLFKLPVSWQRSILVLRGALWNVHPLCG
jgi:hypothetical protein